MFNSSPKNSVVYSLACLGLDGHVEASLKSLLGILNFTRLVINSP